MSILHTISIHQDPLGLRDLPMLEPDKDGWSEIRQALEDHHAQTSKRKTVLSWMAVAASLVLAVSLTIRQGGIEEQGPQIPADQPTEVSAGEMMAMEDGNNVGSLIGLSQTLETQLRQLRDSTGSMPANSAMYVAELEDLVAQVDSELSYSPDSVNLWGQRVNLLLDLAQIYQHHWEMDYGQMASL
jgi:hypothetical protein